MRMSVHELIQAKWTETIHEEWIVAVLRTRTDLTRSQLDHTRQLMDRQASPTLEELGLQIRMTNGTVQLLTGRIQNEKLSAFIADCVPGSSGAGELSQAGLEVHSCIAFKQPISQGEIDQIFGGCR